MGTDTDLADAQTWTSSARGFFKQHHDATIAAIGAITWSGGQMGAQVCVSYVETHKWDQQNPPDGPWKSHPVYRAIPIQDQLTGSTINPSVGSQRRRVRGKRT
jgi:hypothetical protein